MTELEAINEILAGIGEDPVNSLEDGLPDADLAKLTLDQVDQRLQNRGWWFNTDESMELSPDSNGEIELPSDVISVYPNERYETLTIRTKNGKLYDKRNETFQFDKPVKIYAVVRVPWEYLPAVFQDYVAVKATRHFQDNRLSSDKIHNFQVRDEEMARAMLMEEEVEQSYANMHRDSTSVLDVLGRFNNPSRYIP